MDTISLSSKSIDLNLFFQDVLDGSNLQRSLTIRWNKGMSHWCIYVFLTLCILFLMINIFLYLMVLVLK